MPGAAFVLFLEWVFLLGSLLIAGKLYKSGLYLRYRVFFAYFIFRVPVAAYTLLTDVKSHGYFYFWVVTQPLIWIFYAWVVLELCRLVLERHKGLYSLGKWAMYLGMAVSVTLSVLSLLPRINPTTTQRSRAIFYVMAADRGVTFSLAILVLLMLLMISRYPVRLSRNVVLHASLYTIFFLSNTLGVLLQSVFGLRHYTAIDTGLLCVSVICVLAWLFFLTPEGEEVRVNIPHFDPKQEERILYHLDTLNATMLKVSRK
ncbi:MAG: hypothetical protein LAQ69_16940 [Acidobacteriia bacterium]|nr:hypothetical protein [Terriglobia bacterium]